MSLYRKIFDNFNSAKNGELKFDDFSLKKCPCTGKFFDVVIKKSVPPKMASKGRKFTHMKYDSIKINDEEKVYINPKTGEVFESDGTVYIETAEQRLQRQEYFKKQKEIEAKIQLMKKKYEEYSNFTWYFYRINEANLPNLPPVYLVRLIYLATYINYDNTLKRTLKSFITEKDLPKLLDISETEARRFVTVLKRENILLNDVQRNQPVLKLNHELFAKGQLPKSFVNGLEENNLSFTRLYADGIRKIYKQTVSSKRKHLGYVFKLLPYVNKQYNIVCYNPDETNREEIHSIPSSKICELLGCDISHKSRLFRSLLKISFHSGKSIYSIMQYLTYSTEDNIEAMVLINPSIYYAGHNWDEVKILAVNKFKKSKEK